MMTQVEIAEKILAQGNCSGVGCFASNCPMLNLVKNCLAHGSSLPTREEMALRKFIKDNKPKEQKMTDKYVEMTPEEVLAELVKNGECKAYLQLSNGYIPVIISKISSWGKVLSYESGNGISTKCYKKVEQPKQYRQMTHAEIFSAIRDGAVLKTNETGLIKNIWYSDNAIKNNTICYNYTGTDKDVWQEMEIEVK